MLDIPLSYACVYSAFSPMGFSHVCATATFFLVVYTFTATHATRSSHFCIKSHISYQLLPHNESLEIFICSSREPFFLHCLGYEQGCVCINNLRRKALCMLGILISATECLVASFGYSMVWFGENSDERSEGKETCEA